MTQILHAYESVFLREAPYCVLCLRSADERRLVEPQYMQTVLKCIDKTFTYTSNHQKICYVCERQAAAAHRFHNAMELSEKLHELFNKMVKYHKISNQLYAQIYGNKSTKTEDPEHVRNLGAWETQLRAVRARNSLQHTEVLVLNTGLDTPPRCVPARPGPTGAVTGDRSLHSIPAEPEVHVDTVVILDEDEPIELHEAAPPLALPASPVSAACPDPPDCATSHFTAHRCTSVRFTPDEQNNMLIMQSASRSGRRAPRPDASLGRSMHINEGEDDRRKRRRLEPGSAQTHVGSATDWEDKIPMDVISFMDATDPNADVALRTKGPVKPLSPVMGVISDVRSISEDPTTTFNKVLTSDRQTTKPLTQMSAIFSSMQLTQKQPLQTFRRAKVPSSCQRIAKALTTDKQATNRPLVKEPKIILRRLTLDSILDIQSSLKSKSGPRA